MDTDDLKKKFNFKLFQWMKRAGGDVDVKVRFFLETINQMGTNCCLLDNDNSRSNIMLTSSTLHQHPSIAYTLIPPIPRALSFPSEWQWATLNGPWRAERPAGRTERLLSPVRPHVIGWWRRGAAEKVPLCQREEWRSTRFCHLLRIFTCLRGKVLTPPASVTRFFKYSACRGFKGKVPALTVRYLP